MVFSSVCEHASSAFIFASTNSDQICLASSEYLRKTDWLARSEQACFSKTIA